MAYSLTKINCLWKHCHFFSGIHKGRRVVVLHNLEEGNILVTSPYSINVVPFKRVNSAFVIVIRAPLDGVAINIENTYFKKTNKIYEKLTSMLLRQEEKIFKKGKITKTQLRTQAKQTQKTIDAAFIVNIRKIEQSEGYFFIRFSLARGVGPHELRF